MGRQSGSGGGPPLLTSAAATLLGVGLLAALAVALLVSLHDQAPPGSPPGAVDTSGWVFWEAFLVAVAVVIVAGLGAALWLARDARRLLATTRGAEAPHAATPHSPHRLRAALETALRDLAEERDRLRTVLDALGDGVIVLDEALRILSLSPAAARLLQAREVPGGWEGRPLVEVARTPRLHELAALGRGARVQDEVRLGQPARFAFVQAAPLRASGGVVLALHDRTEVHRLERVRADFVANVSHELRTPLAVLQAHAETLVGVVGQDPAAARRFSERLLARARRLAALVDDLLELSRIEAGRRTLGREPVELGAIVEAVLSVARNAAQARGISLTGPLDPPYPNPAPASPGSPEWAAPRAWADPGALEQVLTNLVDNAVKYATRTVAVRVVAPSPPAPRAPTRVRLEVRDDGPGVALHERTRVFERFYRGDDARTAALPGTGLGLAITRHLVLLMGGEIGIADGPDDEGTVFWVELPAAPPPMGVQQDEAADHELSAHAKGEGGEMRGEAERQQMSRS